MNLPADKQSNQVPTRLEKAREYKRKHRAEILAWQKEYNAVRLADPQRRAKKLAQDRASRKRHAKTRAIYDRARDRTKERARQAIRERVYDGRLKRGSCMICGTPNAQAHHEVYERPLQIHWLCAKHHKEAHRNPVMLLTVEPVHVK